MAYFVEQGMTPAVMKENNIGPILFREECIFKKEIAFGDEIKINFFLTRHTSDYGRWSMTHEIWKTDNALAAVIHIDGAWMDTIKRKLALPPQILHAVFDNAPRSAHFEVYKK
jgi:acyl-CoA thioester hydrolase